MTNNPIEELGNILQRQMLGMAQAGQVLALELGVITGDLGLSVASLSNVIPKGDYMVSLRLQIGSLTLNTSGVSLTTETASGPDSHSHSIKSHNHTVTLPIQLRSIQPGDRVLVAWAGTEPIVVDIVVSS